MRRLVAGLVASLLLAGTGGCGADRSGPQEDQAITVFAAASLRGVFTAIADELEDEHPGLTVRLSFAGSSDLVAQLQQGAPADVLATADERTMQLAVDDDLVAVLDELGTNTLRIVTPPGNPAGVMSLADLARPEVRTVLCAPAVPCGASAAQVQEVAGVDISPVSEEQSVTDVLGKVVSGEADAGLVYATDARAAGDEVTAVAFPEAAEVVNTYPIAVLSRSRQQPLAQELVDLVTSRRGQAILARAGFGQRSP